jgi:hypothetical protein
MGGVYKKQINCKAKINYKNGERSNLKEGKKEKKMISILLIIVKLMNYLKNVE